MNNAIENLVLENVRIMFRNFAGKEDKYNREGNRNFAVKIDDPDYIMKIKELGWNVKAIEPKDEDSDPTFYIPVCVSFKVAPPNVYLITKTKKTVLTEENIASLDYAEIKNVDLTLRPYRWEVNGKSGIKAYLKNMYVTIEEDAFASKYSFIDDEDDNPYA